MIEGNTCLKFLCTNNNCLYWKSPRPALTQHTTEDLPFCRHGIDSISLCQALTRPTAIHPPQSGSQSPYTIRYGSRDRKGSKRSSEWSTAMSLNFHCNWDHRKFIALLWSVGRDGSYFNLYQTWQAKNDKGSELLSPACQQMAERVFFLLVGL